jgi:hypothetical protein
MNNKRKRKKKRCPLSGMAHKSSRICKGIIGEEKH